MAQATAGDIVTFVIGEHSITAKVEDASKSECISAKVETSQSADYSVGQVYEFDRKFLSR